MTVKIGIMALYHAHNTILFEVTIRHIYIDKHNNLINNRVNIPIFIFDKFVLFTILLIIVCSVFFKSQLDETKIY